MTKTYNMAFHISGLVAIFMKALNWFVDVTDGLPPLVAASSRSGDAVSPASEPPEDPAWTSWEQMVQKMQWKMGGGKRTMMQNFQIPETIYLVHIFLFLLFDWITGWYVDYFTGLRQIFQEIEWVAQLKTLKTITKTENEKCKAKYCNKSGTFWMGTRMRFLQQTYYVTGSEFLLIPGWLIVAAEARVPRCLSEGLPDCFHQHALSWHMVVWVSEKVENLTCFLLQWNISSNCKWIHSDFLIWQGKLLRKYSQLQSW